jgi:SAM-dependent methyltransferase
MSDHTSYSKDFYEELTQGAISSANVIVPHLLTLFRPNSVLDVGCGRGAWLGAFERAGVNDFLGIDGFMVEQGSLLIPAGKFAVHDLNKPFRLGRGFDLALCLEVAEHLTPESAEHLVESLTQHAQVVLFSASIPYQEGTMHINEQWLEYWLERFKPKGFVPVDCIRPHVWKSKAVRWWYAQNTILYVHSSRLPQLTAVAAEKSRNPMDPISMVHPQLFEFKEQRLREFQSVRVATRLLKNLIVARIQKAIYASR